MGMNDFYITLLFPGAAIVTEGIMWRITGDTGIETAEIHSHISRSIRAKRVSEDMYRIDKFAELYVHSYDGGAAGIYLKCSFLYLEKGLQELYDITENFREKYSCRIIIGDEECRSESISEFEADIKRVYREKYELFCRASSMISGRKYRRKLLK